MNRSVWVGLAVLCVLSAARAGAQVPENVRGQRLYVDRVLFVGSSRAAGLGGAWVAVAEGASYGVNLASLAQPSPWKDDLWGFDLTIQGATKGHGEDVNNDGASDGATNNQGLVGASVRFGWAALGAYVRFSNHLHCPQPPCQAGDGGTELKTGEVALASALALFDGQFVVGSGLLLPIVVVETESGVHRYRGLALGLDALYRPRNRRYRIGAVWRSQQWMPAAPAERTARVERPLPSAAIVAPLLSVGLAIKLDEGGERFNARETRADDPGAPVNAAAFLRETFRNRTENARGRWLLTTQLDMIFAVKNAVGWSYFMHGAPPFPAGNALLLSPRVGIEHVTVPGRLRLRAGSYLEPSAYSTGQPRVHGTVGFDLFLFHFLLDWGLTGAADLAPRLTQTTLSFGVWH